MFGLSCEGYGRENKAWWWDSSGVISFIPFKANPKNLWEVRVIPKSNHLQQVKWSENAAAIIERRSSMFALEQCSAMFV